MRKSRIKAEGAAYYHCMSRVIEKRHIFGDVEKERFVKLMRRLAGFCGMEIITFAVMGNHFHILLKEPDNQEVSDHELIRRLAMIYPSRQVREIQDKLVSLRRSGCHAAAAEYKRCYTYRMHDISYFFKSLKQNFSQWYNSRNGRLGPLWDQRFKSVLVEDSDHALRTMAAYIDLNPVRAGLVEDPKDYRFSGYGAAMGGCAEAMAGIRHIAQGFGNHASWPRICCLYRQYLYLQGEEVSSGAGSRIGFDSETVDRIISEGGRLPLQTVLRCRVRYFSDGLVLGGRDFVEEVFCRYRQNFGAKRRGGARSMQSAAWGELFTMRDIRKSPVSIH